MIAVPTSASGSSVQLIPRPAATSSKQVEVAQLIAGGTVLAAGALMIAGHKRAGLAVALAGTALALLEDREVVETWWKNLPGYLRDAQGVLDTVDGYMKEAVVHGQRLQGILRR